MAKKFSKILTGFTFLDTKWGGVYPGGNYLIYGPKKSGKTLLALKIIEQFIQENYSVLFLTSDRKKNLEIQSNSLYFDINEAISNNSLIVSKIEEGNNIEEIETTIKENLPSILIIDKIVNINIDAYLSLLDFLEDNEITTFFVASIIDDEAAKRSIKLVAKYSTGIIHLKKSNSKKFYSGTIIIRPNVGHFEGEFETSYKVEPIKGFVTLADNENSILEFFSENTLVKKSKEVNQNFEYSNVYSPEEFKILIGSKLAQSDKIGKSINIIKYEIKNAVIEPVELCNTIKKVVSEGDKISFTDKFVYLLPEKDDTEILKKLLADLDKKIESSFPKINEIDNSVIRTKQILNTKFKIL